MRNIDDCIKAFLPLLNTEYEIILGRKEKTANLNISFDKKDCFHLMGLQYLKDRPELNRDREKVFDEIAVGKIVRKQIESSDFYSTIEERVHFFPLLEAMIDSNDTVFKYNQKSNTYSMIEADYLMRNEMEWKAEICFCFCHKMLIADIFVGLFSQRIKEIILKIRPHGHCYIRKRKIY